jgi:tetratricopeptide (TPR) repeat protein
MISDHFNSREYSLYFAMIYYFRGCLLLIYLIAPIPGLMSQIPLLENQKAIDSIYITLRHIYNFEFDEAERMIAENANGLGEHPANYITRAMILYWRDRPLAPETEPYHQYEEYLHKVINLSEPFLESDSLYVEGVFYSMSGYSLLAELYSEEGTGLKVLNTAKKAYSYLKTGKDLVEVFPDFYFSTGLYNYYREKYPDLYPFYKSFLWLFPSGNTDMGIDQIKESKSIGVFTRVESSIYLYHIYLRYENNPDKADLYIKALIDSFPANTRFKSLYTENLVAMGNYQEADLLADTLMNEDKPFHRLSGTLFKAMIFENEGRFDEAETYLDKAIGIEEGMDKKYFHYVSMIYAAKARIADKKGNYEVARDMYKLALKNDPYVPVRDESRAYLGK